MRRARPSSVVCGGGIRAALNTHSPIEHRPYLPSLSCSSSAAAGSAARPWARPALLVILLGTNPEQALDNTRQATGYTAASAVRRGGRDDGRISGCGDSCTNPSHWMALLPVSWRHAFNQSGLSPLSLSSALPSLPITFPEQQPSQSSVGWKGKGGGGGYIRT